MAKTKYYFNSQTLKYEKVKNSFGIKILKVLGFLSSALVFSFLIIALAYTFLDSPKEKQLKREISALSLQYELLLRLQDETDNLTPPASFIASAERYGLMPQIDRWVIRHYFRWLQQHSTHLDKLKLCHINLSGSSLLDPAFKQDVQQMFEHFAIPFNRICFEISESVALVNLQSTLAFIEHFRSQGCQIALDDFGTGYSSLAYLKQFPLNTLKIDKAFVDDMNTARGRNMVDTIVTIAHNLSLTVVAEGVEQAEQLEMLRKLRCEVIQGYYYSKPLSADDFADFLRQHKIQHNKPVAVPALS